MEATADVGDALLESRISHAHRGLMWPALHPETRELIGYFDAHQFARRVAGRPADDELLVAVEFGEPQWRDWPTPTLLMTLDEFIAAYSGQLVEHRECVDLELGWAIAGGDALTGLDDQ